MMDLQGLDQLMELKLILNHAPIGINLLDEKMRIVRLNKFVEKMLGVRTEEVRGKYCWEVAGRKNEPCDNCGVIKTLKDGRTRSFERRVGKFIIRNTAVPVIEDGRVVAVVELIQDVTERKKIEEELKKSEAKYRDLFENSLDIIAVTNLKGEYVDINKAFERVLGYTREEVIGKSYREIVGSEEVADRIFEMYNRAFREKRDLYGLEAEITAKNGRKVVLEGNVRLMKDGDRVIAFQGNFRDITERKRLENSLEELNELLRLLNKILRHDIINDLAAIRAAIELFLENSEITLLEKVLERIDKSIKLIQQMRELEELSKFRQYKTIRIKDVVREISRKYSISINLRGDGMVLANDALLSVFDNIFSNAVKHGGASRIDIDVEKDGDYYEIRISDNGKGIASDIKSSIFDEGFSYGESGGSGLGLYICKKIIDACGGTIDIDSMDTQTNENTKRNGAVFVIKLKRAA